MIIGIYFMPERTLKRCNL